MQHEFNTLLYALRLAVKNVPEKDDIGHSCTDDIKQLLFLLDPPADPGEL